MVLGPVGSAKKRPGKGRLVRTSLRVSDDLYHRIVYYRALLDADSPARVSVADVFRACMLRTLDEEGVPAPTDFVGWLRLRRFIDTPFQEAVAVAEDTYTRGQVDTSMPDTQQRSILLRRAKSKAFSPSHVSAVKTAWKAYQQGDHSEFIGDFEGS